MLFIYRLLVGGYGLLIRVAALFFPKAAKFAAGRKGWRSQLSAALADNARPVLWLHAASLGEYEQGKLLADSLKRAQGYFLLVSFFSPSGLEQVRKSWDKNLAQQRPELNIPDHICYLPLDNPQNAADFLDIVRPALVIWVKYELWYYYIKEIARRGCPSLLIAAIFHPKHLIFRWYGSLQRELMDSFTHIFTQEPESVQRVGEKKLSFAPKLSYAGDPRVDSILQTLQNWQPQPIVAEFVAGSPCLVLGSSHIEDLEFSLHFIPTLLKLGWKILVVPHEVDEPSIQASITALRRDHTISIVRYSELSKPADPNAAPPFRFPPNLLLLDTVGLLRYVYHYAQFAYIGGGFSGGVHNVLEAAAYKIPTAFAGKLHKFAELAPLIRLETAFHIQQNSPSQAQQLFDFILSSQFPDKQPIIHQRLTDFFAQQQGATQRIIDAIRLLLSTKLPPNNHAYGG